MSDLMRQLAEFNAQMQKDMPEDVRDLIGRETEKLKQTGIEDLAVKDGEAAPGFTLRNQLGEQRTLDGFLANGPVVLSFYRGGW